MFVTARVNLGETAVHVAVPDTAIQMLDGEPVLFLPRGEGFAPVPVPQIVTLRYRLGDLD